MPLLSMLLIFPGLVSSVVGWEQCCSLMSNGGEKDKGTRVCWSVGCVRRCHASDRFVLGGVVESSVILSSRPWPLDLLSAFTVEVSSAEHYRILVPWVTLMAVLGHFLKAVL